MQPEFYSEPIQVETDAQTRLPKSFRWRGKSYVISAVEKEWQDWGFGATEPRRKNWRLRHHRNYFLVKTDDNQVFKIYYDRGTKLTAPKTWILLTKEG